MNLQNLHGLWRTCRLLASNGNAKSAREAFALLHPMATVQQMTDTLKLGTLLEMLTLGADKELTSKGQTFQNLEHWKIWKPVGEQAKVLKSLGLSWEKTAATNERRGILDLFCGAGGLGLGFEMAGFASVIAIDNDAQALQAHEENFPSCKAMSGDIHALGKEPIKKLAPLLEGRELAGVVGGPPCQGFSYIGERVVTDERNMLTSRFMDIVTALQPDFFVMENVAGLLTSGTRPRFSNHLSQYAKTIGPAAAILSSALPDQPKAPNRRERQYNKRLVSSAVAVFQGRLKPKLTTSQLIAEVTSASKLLGNCINDAIAGAYDGATLAKARKSVAENEKAIILIAVSSVICRHIVGNKKTADIEAQEMIQSCQSHSSLLGEVCGQLMESYFSLEPASAYYGASVGPVLRHLIERASKDYVVSAPRILSAAWYGAPQDRRRLFLVGIHKRMKRKFIFPEPSHYMRDNVGDLLLVKPAITCEQAIGELPDVDRYPELLDHDKIPSDERRKLKSEFSMWMAGERIPADDHSLPRETWDPFVLDCCKRTTHSPHVLERLQSVAHGVLDSTSGKTRLKPNDVAHTLRAGTREAMGSHTAVRPIHYTHDRVISVREGARLMGYPDWMTFHPTKWHGFRLVGNGVPAQLGRAIALSIKQQIYGK